MNFEGLDGSCLPNLNQSKANIGANAHTQNGATDCSHVNGYAHPKMVFRVARSAKRLSVVPACSYPAQKITQKTNRIPMTPIFIQSVRVSGGAGAFGCSSTARASGSAGVRYFFPREY